MVLAMMKYKSQGVEPEFSGSEKFIWPAIKHDIDTDNDFAKIKQQNAAKRSKIEQDEARQSKTEQSAQVKVKDNNPLTPLQGESGSVPKSKTFTPPTPEEVNAYCQERKNGIDGKEFCVSSKAAKKCRRLDIFRQMWYTVIHRLGVWMYGESEIIRHGNNARGKGVGDGSAPQGSACTGREAPQEKGSE